MCVLYAIVWIALLPLQEAAWIQDPCAREMLPQGTANKIERLCTDSGLLTLMCMALLGSLLR